MGTAVIPLALSFTALPIKMPLVNFFLVLSIFMFVVTLVPWTLKFFLYPENVKKDFKHPVAASFFPTMPISLVIFALDFLKYPTLFFSENISYRLAFFLWLMGSIGIYAMGFPILLQTFRHRGIDLTHANFGWYIPPVSKLIIPVAGFELAGIFPQYIELTFGLSIISLGVGFFLFLFVGAAVYHRYIYHELPMSKFAATFFIGIAPTAIIAVIIFKMIHLFESGDVLGIAPHVFTPIGKVAVLMNWGMAIWWFIMAILVIVYYMRRIELPYALSWWAFTFPSGALCVSTGVAWKVSGFSSIFAVYNIILIFLLVVWAVVFVRTGLGMISGKIFAPAH
jgi:C4-dicarboxylate transporter/malic acid transport protein